MVWSIIAVLAALAAIVIFRSGSARSEANYRTKLYNELEEEYKNYKAKANEKEKKLARELQTERNKVDELMGRGWAYFLHVLFHKNICNACNRFTS